MTAPAITVLMAVHNGEQFLAETLRSVAQQSFTDYEFLIVDDASTDRSVRLLSAAADADKRIRIIRNAENIGLTRSLNRGLAEAQGTYVARIDADDVCLPERLAVQHAFMETHPDHVGVCSGFHLVDIDGRVLRRSQEALDDWQVRWKMAWEPPAPHPTFFFRRLAPDGKLHRYDETFRTAQDYDFWERLTHHGKTCVLPDILLRYRRHDGAITKARRTEQAANCAIVGRRALSLRYPAARVEVLETLVRLFWYEQKADVDAIGQAVAGANSLLAHDLPLAPTIEHRRWLRKSVAGVLAAAVLSRGGALSSAKLLGAFLWEAKGHLPDLFRAVADEPGLARKVVRGRR